MMHRRAFVAGMAAVMVAPLAVEAQQAGKTYRLGVAWAISELATAPYRAELEAGLRELGWVAGRNIAFEHRFSDDPVDFPKVAASVLDARVDAIAAMTNAVVAAVANATTDKPIVGVYMSDPVSAGFALSLPRPGKNITGMTLDASPGAYAKQLELLKEIVPNARRVQVLRNPEFYKTFNQQIYNTTVEAAAQRLRLEIYFSDVRTVGEIEHAILEGGPKRSAVYAMLDLLTFVHGPVIATLAAKQRLPTIFGFREAVEAGALASYGPDLVVMPRYAARFIDRLFRGARASDLPIEQPTKFELVINLKTARALGLTVPPSLLLRADRVIE
jgi:ABC-type uncharacterized transport system substrate-binding protein